MPQRRSRENRVATERQMRLGGTLASFDTSTTSAAAARTSINRDHEHHRDDEFSHDANDPAPGLRRQLQAVRCRPGGRCDYGVY